MPIESLLVANRGEIAIRIMRAAGELGIRTVAVYSEDDSQNLHTRKADVTRPLEGQGVTPYLDIAQLIAVARQAGCDSVHPGYGFLAESSEFARACEEAGLTFVGPRPETLDLFGAKTEARALAVSEEVPIVPGLSHSVSAGEAEAFFAELPQGSGMLIKAIAGGGGRGMRTIVDAGEIASAFERCASEARQAFGDPSLYVEQLVPRARHIEVQIAGDEVGTVTHFGERDCSIQRRHQKLIEIAPAPSLEPALRERIANAAVRLATASGYRNLGTFEFIVDADDGEEGKFWFIEANARLQVEHTVTEEVTGIDLVQLQLRLAAGELLAGLGLSQEDVPSPRGFAVQARVNMETMATDGSTRPSSGTLTAFDIPSGPGVRTDSFGYAGYRTSSNFDSLLAKVISHSTSPNLADALKRTSRALADFRIEGVVTNIDLLQTLLAHPDLPGGGVYTRFVDDHVAALVDPINANHPRRFFERAPALAPSGQAGVNVDTSDPLAVLAHGKEGGPAGSGQEAEFESLPANELPEGVHAVLAPLQGTIVTIDVAEGDAVREGQLLLVMNAMKMEHEVYAQVSGIVREVTVSAGDTIYEEHPVILLDEANVDGGGEARAEKIDLDHVRTDLSEVQERHAATLDKNRSDAVARRRRTKQRTARENVDDLCDSDTFVEHGSLALTPGTGLPLEEVVRRFPTDGMITGVGSVNGQYFEDENARCVILAYDYTVLAGTQGAVNHPKTDRMLELAGKWRRPVVFFTEGGGGRAGTGGRREGGQATAEAPQIGGYRPLDTPTFATMAKLSGLVPIVGVTSGRCFAGNAVLLGCCDVIIATANSNIGLGGPAMIEGGGLGVFTPEEVGPMSVQVPNGVVDIAVEDEEEAVQAAKKYLSYFQGSIEEWDCSDQRILRTLVPENRLRAYNVRSIIETMADTGSVLELRPHFGVGMVTAFIRIEGRAVGVIANNATHLGGAVDSDGADKGARFMQLCDAFDIPILFLVDTPGMMVGPEVERTALARHSARLFVTGANLTVPHVAIFLRKGYGLGAQAMVGGNTKEPFFTAAWPTGEFGGMGLEGQIKLGYRNELEAIEDPEERMRRYQELVERAYERGKALNQGVAFGIDDVIDPMDSRLWISAALRSVPSPPRREGKKRQNIDTW
ncbi:MAG: carbamoyl-phosphate synthase large subunit [Dehalococcoidia bacterium]|nr:carbamoyl-phosphate synthase large subunit [Dehalococcoidia bacterium]